MAAASRRARRAGSTSRAGAPGAVTRRPSRSTGARGAASRPASTASRIESKDTLRKAAGARTSPRLDGSGDPRRPWPACLRALGVRDGRARRDAVRACPRASGLGESVGARRWRVARRARAGSRARTSTRGRSARSPASKPRAPGRGRRRPRTTTPRVRGGVLALHPEAGGPAGRAAWPSTRPAIEESLLLVRGRVAPGGGRGPATARASAIAGHRRARREALLAGRFEDLVALWAEEWEARRRRARLADAGAERIAGIVRGGGRGGPGLRSGGGRDPGAVGPAGRARAGPPGGGGGGGEGGGPAPLPGAGGPARARRRVRRAPQAGYNAGFDEVAKE